MIASLVFLIIKVIFIFAWMWSMCLVLALYKLNIRYNKNRFDIITDIKFAFLLYVLFLFSSHVI